MRVVKVGSRGSDLAVTQTRHIIERLREVHQDLQIRHEIIRTQGDEVQDQALKAMGGQGVFTKEIENALIAGTIDLAVHSLKDLPSTLHEGLELGAVPFRESPREVLCGATLKGLPEGGIVATGSPRRQAQLLALRKDLKVVPIRGNVPTRLARLEAQGDDRVDAVMLAEAGLRRLGVPYWGERLPMEEFPPAVGQGTLGLEIRSEDVELRAWLQSIHHAATAACVAAERSLLRALEAGCSTPIGAYSRFVPGPLLLVQAHVTALDGSRVVKARVEGPASQAEDLGKRLAEALRKDGAQELLDAAS
ncbi:MAG: hydroxymethylbilane synthase [Planctomycetes bacterium]|nr:hydroxymethylbilane synthase [Planctomycetota bacterium]